MPATGNRGSRVVLAFDWGTRKIGVAVGQEVTGTATPLSPVKARQGVPDWDELEHLVASWQPQLFLVGIPLNMDGSESDSSRRAARFGRRLSGRFGIEWAGVDERLSTVEARNASASGESQQSSVDSQAACVIAESWLREQRAASA